MIVVRCSDYKMKVFCFVTFSLLSFVVADLYSSRYDNFNVQPLLENDRILLGYINCFLDKGHCTAEAKDFKRVIPESLETTCRRCTPKQKQLVRTVVRAIIQKHPKSWEQLINKYDSNRKHKKSFDEFIYGSDK